MEKENKILEILDLVQEKVLSPDEALPQILLLFSFSGSFSNEKEHLCWANADFNNKCFICGKENCR